MFISEYHYFADYIFSALWSLSLFFCSRILGIWADGGFRFVLYNQRAPTDKKPTKNICIFLNYHREMVFLFVGFFLCRGFDLFRNDR